MKKTAFIIALGLMATAPAFGQNKALYVKKGDAFTKYNFGVSGDLIFSNNGHQLVVTGYDEVIDLDQIDYISFNAPVVTTALKPAAQKERLVQIGEKVNSMFSVYDQRRIIVMFDRFFRGVYDSRDRYIAAPGEYDVPQEYWDVHNEFRAMAKAARKLLSGNVASVGALRARALNLYKLSDYFGVYIPNSKTKSWERSSKADYLEIRFTSYEGKSYTLKLTASSDYSEYASPDGILHWPKEINISMSEGTDELASVKLTSEIVKDKSFALTTHVVANKYVVNDELVFTNDKGTEHTIVDIDGKRLAEVVTDIKGHNLMVYDEMRGDSEGAFHHHDDEGNCLDGDAYPAVAHFTRAQSKADVLGELQVKGYGTNITRLYDEFKEDAYEEDLNLGNGWWTSARGIVIDHNSSYSHVHVSLSDTEMLDRQAEALGNYTDATFHYDGQSEVQGFLAYDVDKDYDSWDIQEYYPQFNEDPEDLYIMYGYTIVNNRLVDVYRKKNTVWGPWYYNMYHDTDDYMEYAEVVVDEKDVIYPSVITYHDSCLEAKLMFSDLTGFYVEDFFDYDSFSALADDVEDIIDTYYTITGQERDDDYR